MSKWSSRSNLYKAAFGLTIFVFLVYGLAFSIPSWLGSESSASYPRFQGLWMLCNGSNEIDFDDCDEHSFGDDWSWMDAVRGCWVGGMFLYLVGVLYGLIENCCGYEDSRDYGITGTLVLLAGLGGGAGVILTAVKVEDDNTGYDEYLWGYMIACIASGLAILLALVLIIARKSRFDDGDSAVSEDDKQRHGSARAFDYINNYGKPAQGYGWPYEYHNGGYAGDAYGHRPQQYPPGMTPGHDIPLGNGVSYQHQSAQAPSSAHPYTMYQGNPNSLPRQNGGGNWRHSVAESADLSNGYTPGILQAEQYSMGRPVGRGDYYAGGSRPY